MKTLKLKLLEKYHQVENISEIFKILRSLENLKTESFGKICQKYSKYYQVLKTFYILEFILKIGQRLGTQRSKPEKFQKSSGKTLGSKIYHQEV